MFRLVVVVVVLWRCQRCFAGNLLCWAGWEDRSSEVGFGGLDSE